MDKFEVVKTDEQGRELHKGMHGVCITSQPHLLGLTLVKVFADLTNSVLVDDRIFHMQDANSFLENMEKQTMGILLMDRQTSYSGLIK